MKWIIVNKETLQIMGSYEAEVKDDSSAKRSWLLAEPVCKHVELPGGLEEELSEAALVDGEIVLQFSSAKEDAQIARAWSALRTQRDALLAETDKYMLTDYPISSGNKTAMETYRNALRDLPSQVTDPRDTVTWPTKPQL
jgi:hypothetical protein